MVIKDKRIIITGGASGIGKHLSEKLLGEGAIVGVFDIHKEAGHRDNKGPAYDHLICDISDPLQVEKAVEEFYSKHGTIDILINNAGMVYNSPLLSINMDTGDILKHDVSMWDKVIGTNLNGVFYMSSQVVSKMFIKRTQGLIINISSICADGNAGQSAYSASKAGMDALTVVWAKELGGLGIRVAGIAPGFVKTETTIRSMSEGMVHEWVKKTPIKRMAEIPEIIEGVLFIIKSDFFNGRILKLDGGLRI